MADFDINERELAAGAAIMRDMERQDRRENELEERNQPSGSAVALSVAFVAITSVGLLAVMLYFGN